MQVSQFHSLQTGKVDPKQIIHPALFLVAFLLFSIMKFLPAAQAAFNFSSEKLGLCFFSNYSDQVGVAMS